MWLCLHLISSVLYTRFLPGHWFYWSGDDKEADSAKQQRRKSPTDEEAITLTELNVSHLVGLIDSPTPRGIYQTNFPSLESAKPLQPQKPFQ